MRNDQARPVPTAPAAETPICANCGVEIPWPAAVHLGKAYCCGGCAQGGPCYCSYDLTNFDWLYPAARREQISTTPTTAMPAPGDGRKAG